MDFIPYLTFHGKCREAMTFYADLLGGEIIVMQSFGETPMAAEFPKEAHDQIMHASLKVGTRRLHGSDGMPGDTTQIQGISVALDLPDTTRAAVIFDALAEGGTVRMPFSETFWAKGFGMVTDRFGTPWMVNVD